MEWSGLNYRWIVGQEVVWVSHSGMPSPQPGLLSAAPQHPVLLFSCELGAGFKLWGIRIAVVLCPCSTQGMSPTVLRWKCPLSISAHGLSESLSLGKNLSKDEAIFDLVFTFRVKIKRYMKHKLGILCLVLDPLTPPISPGCQASG